MDNLSGFTMPISRLSWKVAPMFSKSTKKRNSPGVSATELEELLATARAPGRERRRLAAHVLCVAWFLLPPWLWTGPRALAARTILPVFLVFSQSSEPSPLILFSSRLFRCLCWCPFLVVADSRSGSQWLFSSRLCSLPRQRLKFARCTAVC